MIQKCMMLVVAAALISAGCSRSDKPFGDDADRIDEGSLREGLAVCFTFEDGVTNSGAARYLVSTKGVSIEKEGRFGAAGRFGNDAFISVARARIPPEGSWCLWMRPDANQKEPEQRLLDANGYVIGILNKQLYVTYNDGKARTITSHPARTGEWTHVAMTWGTNSLKMYVNGEILGQHMLSGMPGFPVRTILAGVRWTGSTKAFSGLLDDICIYERALADNEVKRLASAGLPAEQTPTLDAKEPAAADSMPKADPIRAERAEPHIEAEATDAALATDTAEPAVDETVVNEADPS